MAKKYQFEEIRLYAILSYIFMSLMYSGIYVFCMPTHILEHNRFPFATVNFMFFSIYNLTRYRYFSTEGINRTWVFLLLGCLDMFALSFYFGVPPLDQGGKIVIMFILIMANIYRGRRIGIILTLFWFPVKVISDFIFMNLAQPAKGPDFHAMMRFGNIIDALYFQIMLVILVFITEVIYRQISNKEKENKRLFNKLEDQYKALNIAQVEIEAKNDRLKEANVDLEDVNKKLAHRIAELFTMQQISNAIGSILDTDELMKYVNDITLGVMGVKDSTIILFNEKASKLEVRITNITDEKEYAILCNSVNCGGLLSILEGGNAVCDNKIDSDKFIFTKDRDVKSLICAPIVSKLKKFGLILIEQNFENAFDIDKVRLLTVIAQQVGMAMENAHLYQEMHELAVKDNLTGVYNRMYFHQRLEAELLNAENERYEVTVAMLDIDYFKKINDTYGHLVGDKVLISVTELINISIRREDVMARFGGEEFIILFPNTSLTRAYELVEELREKIASTEVEYNSLSISVTASFGIASFPQSSSNIMELLKDVDDALYEAKDSGRNCVKISKEVNKIL